MLDQHNFIINCDGILPINFFYKKKEECVIEKRRKKNTKKSIIEKRRKKNTKKDVIEKKKEVEVVFANKNIITLDLIECSSYM